MNVEDEDDICTRLAKDLYRLYVGPLVASVEQEDLIERGRQLTHEAMFRAAFEGCVSRGCHKR